MCIRDRFRMVGTLIGRCILDHHVIDLPLNTVFWAILLDRPVRIEDMKKVDPVLGDMMIGLQEIVNKKREIERDARLSIQEKTNHIRSLTLHGATIEDLTLNFTLPGFEKIELIENGEDMPVTLSNLDQYVSLVTQYFFTHTLKAQTIALREGFSRVLPLSSLNCFSSEEINKFVCGASDGDKWDLATLQEHVMPAYGYTRNSESYNNILMIMTEFNVEDRKTFLKFVTGCPRLPFGGFKNLNPKLTIVKRVSAPDSHPDDHLPSVMTCQNYLKLPEYSSIEVMRMKLTYAMNEGLNSFALSQISQFVRFALPLTINKANMKKKKINQLYSSLSESGVCLCRCFLFDSLFACLCLCCVYLLSLIHI
eukprot:TRINITY_DN1150_c0_g2_i4.p1 TRINITY_DN1150_c0_g2~~TRINITY_DN1150_c0_g2_i4.p1  ORF type:complete len:382 (-),score=52.78 TRINITY_DN1150_c0_g2_i4:60-1157(-)